MSVCVCMYVCAFLRIRLVYVHTTLYKWVLYVCCMRNTGCGTFYLVICIIVNRDERWRRNFILFGSCVGAGWLLLFVTSSRRLWRYLVILTFGRECLMEREKKRKCEHARAHWPLVKIDDGIRPKIHVKGF